MWILCEGNCFDKVKGIQHFILLYQEPVGHFRPQPSVIELMLFKFNERNNPSSSLKKLLPPEYFHPKMILRDHLFLSQCVITVSNTYKL